MLKSHMSSQKLGLSQNTTWRILRRNMGLHPYKIQLTQELKVIDNDVFLLNEPNFHRKIIFSDEADFWMNGRYVKKQNCRILNENNPCEMQERPMNSERSLFGVDFGLTASSVHIL